VIQDGGTGYLFHSGSFEAFNQAVIAVLGQSLLELHDIGSRAKARISAEYDWDRTADLTEEIYRGLIDGK
jgi:glycosyltransferase involved in cell wall biosynthesis